MSELTVLQHEDFGRIRAEVRGEELWFVAKDVCDSLGLTNSRKATASLEADEKGMSLIVTPSGAQQMTVVNESGLYSLIFQSRKLRAKGFRKWVTSEVLPSIRKTGRYEAKRKKKELPAGVSLLDMLDVLLDKNDRNQIAREQNVPRRAVTEVMQGRSTNKRLMNALYERAMENKSVMMGMYNAVGNNLGLLIN